MNLNPNFREARLLQQQQQTRGSNADRGFNPTETFIMKILLTYPHRQGQLEIQLFHVDIRYYAPVHT